AGSKRPKPAVENDYSRPRLHHRAPPVTPLTLGAGGGVSTAPVRRSKRKVESMHATPHPEGVTAEDQRRQQATGSVGSDAISRDTRSGGGGGNGIVRAGAGVGGGSEKGAVK
ncbi:unnamed protein product, partial [Ectocarpus sp. 12 AP-2014]